MAGGFEQLDAVPGFSVPVHRALTEHILLGGAPRSIAIVNGTLAGAVGLGLRLWLVGLAIWAVGHPRILQPALAKFTKTLGFLDAALLASPFEGRRDAILNHQLGFDQLLAGARKRNARWAVSANDHRFPAPVQTVVEAEGQRAGR
jgi:type IV secretory pathway TrbD component